MCAAYYLLHISVTNQLYFLFYRYITSLAFSQIKERQAGTYTLLVTSKTGNYTVVVPVLIRSKYVYMKGVIPSIGSRAEAQVQSKQ